MIQHILLLIGVGGGLMACHSTHPPKEDAQDSTTFVGDSSVPQAPETEPSTEPEPEPSTEPASEPSSEPACEGIHGEGEPLAVVNDCDTLSYGLYPAHDETGARHRLPDFSFAGYMGGGVPLPSVPAILTLEPQAGDNHAQIQSAIDSISTRMPDSNGHRGAILLRAGTYNLSEGLTINASGVVIRGEGQGTDGTVLYDMLETQHSSIVISGGGSGINEMADSRTAITSDVPVGSTELEVADSSGFQIGDLIGVQRTPNQDWIDGLDMAQYGWTASSYTITHERRITTITGNTLSIDIPIVDAMNLSHGGGTVFKAEVPDRIEQIGIENLRLVSIYSSNTDEDHGWTAIQIKRTLNSWVRAVTTVHYGYSAVSIESESNFNTVQDVAYLDPKSQVTGARRYAFNLSDGLGNLFQRCYSEAARHDFVSGARTTGPNVWLDCYSSESSNDDGPHHRWATGLLFDNVSSYMLHVENRQDSGTGHGWSGAQTLFWNSRASGNVICDTPKWAMNWSIGVVGTQADGNWAPQEPACWWENHNTPVEPRSLYLKQLEARLGTAAVQNITTSEQRQGRLWNHLRQWAGTGPFDTFQLEADPNCETGILNGNVCCLDSCGSCGGQGCGSRPGGAEGCCTGTITDAGNTCETNLPPCILGQNEPAFEPIGE